MEISHLVADGLYDFIDENSHGQFYCKRRSLAKGMYLGYGNDTETC